MTAPADDEPAPLARPVAVAVAAWLVAVPAAVLVGLSVLGAIGLLLLGSRVVALVDELAPAGGQGAEARAMLLVGLTAFVVLLAAGVVQLVLVVRLLRGGGIARVVLTGWQAVHAVVLLPVLGRLLVDPSVPLTSRVTMFTCADVAASVGVVVLLWSPASREWFRARRQAVRSARASRSSPSSMTGRSFENVQRTSVRPPPGASGRS